MHKRKLKLYSAWGLTFGNVLHGQWHYSSGTYDCFDKSG